jgi:hypothetical protein
LKNRASPTPRHGLSEPSEITQDLGHAGPAASTQGMQRTDNEHTGYESNRCQISYEVTETVSMIPACQHRDPSSAPLQSDSQTVLMHEVGHDTKHVEDLYMPD